MLTNVFRVMINNPFKKKICDQKIPTAINRLSQYNLTFFCCNKYLLQRKISLPTVAINFVAIGYRNKIFVAIVFCCNKLVTIKQFLLLLKIFIAMKYIVAITYCNNFLL